MARKPAAKALWCCIDSPSQASKEKEKTVAEDPVKLMQQWSPGS